MSKQSKEVLEHMGLSDGYHIPIANAENIKLEQELQRLILTKAKSTATLESLDTRCSGLEKHLKYVRTEQLDYQNLLITQTKQLENERNVYTAIKMEKERYSQDIRKITSDLLKFEAQKETKCAHLDHLVSKLDKLKLSVKWDEKTIELLEKQVAKKTDGNETLKKFSNEDQKRVKELEIKRLRLREEEIARRQLVIRVANEIECAELTVGRNVQMYKQMCDERNTMVRQWQESVKQLQQINKNTLEIFAEIHVLREQIQTNNQTLEEQRQFAENERANNYQLEMHIAQDKAETAQLRMKLEKTLATVQDRNAEKNEISRDLRVTALALEKLRAEIRKFDSALAKQKVTFAATVEAIARLKDKLTAVTESSVSTAERLRQLDEMIKAEENLHKSSLYDIERMQETLFRSQSALAELKDGFKVKEMSQKILDTGIVSLKKQIAQTENQCKKTAEAIYNLNLRVNFLESRLARATGEREDENVEENHLKLEELEVTMTRLTETGNLIQSQITRVEDDMRRLTTNISTDATVLGKLKDRLQDNLLLVEGAIKRVEQNQARNNKIRVNQNVLAVRVQGAERALKKEGCVVYNIQLHKMELQCAIQERQTEIQAQYELLYTKRRALENDVGRMNADIQNRDIRIEQLKKRVECVLSSLGKSEDGQPLSVTYFKVRNAQEKYNLQEEGDRLDALIRKTEREIVAMENTLRVMNDCNASYKNTLALLEDDAEEIALLQKLQDRLAEISQELRATNGRLTERSRFVRGLRASLENARTRFQEISEEKIQQQGVLNDVTRGENERKLMLARAESASKLTDCVCGDEYKDMTTRQLREVNKVCLQQLAEISIRHLAAAPIIHRYLLERNLTLPSTSLSSRASSRRSTTSGRSVKTAKSEASATSVISAVTLTLNFPC